MKYKPEIVKACFEQNGIVCPEFEHKFCPDRNWMFDLAWPESKVALEVQGGIFIAGRHNRGGALLKEWEKLNTASAMGWRVLFFQPKDLLMLETINTIKKALENDNTVSKHTANMPRDRRHGYTTGPANAGTRGN